MLEASASLSVGSGLVSWWWSKLLYLIELVRHNNTGVRTCMKCPKLFVSRSDFLLLVLTKILSQICCISCRLTHARCSLILLCPITVGLCCVACVNLIASIYSVGRILRISWCRKCSRLLTCGIHRRKYWKPSRITSWLCWKFVKHGWYINKKWSCRCDCDW